MTASLLFPNLPALSLQMALGTRKPVLVHAGGRVIAPRDLAGLPLERAMALRPHYCPLTRQPALERAAWEHIVEEVFRFTPLISDAGLGRLYCAPDDLAAVRTLMESTSACVGLAPTRTMALLAALGARPGSMVTIDADDIAPYLDTLPVERLIELEELEIHQAMVERLRLFGLGTVGRLRRLTRSQLKAQFGQCGVHVHELLRSIADASPLPLHVPPPVCEAVVRLDDGTHEPALLETMLRKAVDDTVSQLGQRRSGRVEVALLDKADQPLHTSSRILRAPTQDVRHLHAQTSAMLAKAVGSKPLIVNGEQQVSTQRLTATGKQFFGVHVRLGALALIPPSQTSLFAIRPTISEISAPMARRFPQAIKRVTVIDAHAYVPDRFASIEPWKPVA